MTYHKLKEDKDLSKRTGMKAESIIKLIRICVEETYFVFNQQIYIQVEGLAIGAATSGFMAELFMERFEERAISTFINPPGIYKRYVDDTFLKIKEEEAEKFLEHMNNQHIRIRYTMEKEKEKRIAFLDTEVWVKENKEIKVTIYRKSTHTDQYLDWNSHHHVSQKMGIIDTFRRRIDVLVTEDEDKKKEEEHVIKALRRCGHPPWSLSRKRKKKEVRKEDKEEPKAVISIPYIKGVSEKLAREYKKHGIKTVHKPERKLKDIICSKKKDKVDELDKGEIIYEIECTKHEENYIGETGGPKKVRGYQHKVVTHKDMKRSHSIKEDNEAETEDAGATRRSSRTKQKKDYKKMNSGSDQHITLGNTPVSEHLALMEHEEGDIVYKTIGTERYRRKREIKEAIEIMRRNPTLNLDEGKQYIAPIYKSVIKRNYREENHGDQEEDQRQLIEIDCHLKV